MKRRGWISILLAPLAFAQMQPRPPKGSRQAPKLPKCPVCGEGSYQERFHHIDGQTEVCCANCKVSYWITKEQSEWRP